MLTAEQIIDLAEENGFRATSYWESSSDGHRLPTRKEISLWLRDIRPEAWEILMSNLTEVPVSLMGTRVVSGSGALDGRLFPEYRALLKGVNEKRAAIGLPPVLD